MHFLCADVLLNMLSSGGAACGEKHTEVSTAKTVMVANYSYSFLPAAFLNRTRFYFKAGAYQQLRALAFA